MSLQQNGLTSSNTFELIQLNCAMVKKVAKQGLTLFSHMRAYEKLSQHCENSEPACSVQYKFVKVPLVIPKGNVFAHIEYTLLLLESQSNRFEV